MIEKGRWRWSAELGTVGRVVSGRTVSGGDIPGLGARRPVAVVYSDDSTGPADGDDTGAVAAMLASAAG